ncbi:MAG TPA: TAT-variant-translocated molybdopterin oxidoreductase [Pirellulales bacterium]|jgi:molybdopterin-containing oxidoreductase family iron-sulfur binding subunit|nr:TAT-variant-translocated molybdopterin oxidoreductase [Pirellulales bacterium]
MNSSDSAAPIDLAALNRRAASSTGRTYWKSLEELAQTPEFRERVVREFPQGASEWDDALGRRKFLALMGASLGLAGLAGCNRQPPEEIYPYVRAPEFIVPGKPLFFATALTLGGVGSGVLVESHMGRPTKIEGNPEHPGSLGTTDLFTQAAVLSMYDPDRSQVVLNIGEIDTWEACVRDLRAAIEATRPRQGRGLHILSETVTSPALADQLAKILGDLPQAVWHQYEPVNRDAERAGATLAFGSDVQPVYHLDRAEVIVSLDSDFLTSGPGCARYQHDFADARRVRQTSPRMNRLYAVESTPTLTGASADHRLPLRAAEIVRFARALAGRLGLAPQGFSPASTVESPGRFDPEHNALHAAWLEALADDLQRQRGTALVVAGAHQSPAVHALAHLMNSALGAVGTTVTYIAPLEAQPKGASTDQTASLAALAEALEQDEVDVLLILGGNPVYTAPVDLRFGARLPEAKQSLHLSLYADETSAVCEWHVPAAHELESWGDVRAYDGTVTIQQPLIAPLFNGRSSYEMLSALFDSSPRSTYDVVKDYWRGQRMDGDFERFWQTSVHDGVVADTAATVRPVTAAAANSLRDTVWSEAPSAGSDEKRSAKLEIIFRPDPTIWDGRFANHGWLQELAKPLMKLSWDNAALVGPATADRLKLANTEIVELRYGDRKIEAPIWVLPGHVDDSVTVLLGYGRTRAGRIGTGIGYDAYRLRTSDAPSFDDGLELVKTGRKAMLAATDLHWSMEGRNIVRSGTLDEYRLDPASPAHAHHEESGEPQNDKEHNHGEPSHEQEVHAEVAHAEHEHASLYPPFKDTGYAWGMSIDLGACTGCSACVIACQAENNSPVVGKDAVMRSREMHWLRIDRYYSGQLDNPEVLHQPMLCQQCEQAPCEVVCPVAATTHSPEGLNEMTYNRCVGTRYCSNNCPYKVRRFNFFNYHPDETPLTAMIYNPDVTVRSRGVMEKCTFCVQRINEAKIAADVESSRVGHQVKVADGGIVTACQAACPSGAIVFGDVNDPKSRVSQAKAEPTDYGLLTELNTHPRVTYLARVRNPQAALLAAEEQHRTGPAVRENIY